MRDRGAIAQLGERLDRTQEVGGSSPPSSIADCRDFSKAVELAAFFSQTHVLLERSLANWRVEKSRLTS